MSQTNTSKLSTWVFWAPLRFAITSFIALGIVGILYTLIAGKIYAPAPIPMQPLLWLCAITCIGCIAAMLHKLPCTNIDRFSFIAIHNIQMLIATIFFIAFTYTIISNANEIIFRLILLETKSQPYFILTIFTFAIVTMYFFGILLSNIFAKIRRIQTLNIPTWKIICCIPFGFSALWTPGYILETNNKANAVTIKSNWYKKLTNKITEHQSSIVATFSVITMLSGFIYGLSGILLTYTLALIFGIWVLNIGTKKFLGHIAGKYTNWAIVVNIILIITFTVIYNYRTNTNKNIQINITETAQTINL